MGQAGLEGEKSGGGRICKGLAGVQEGLVESGGLTGSAGGLG